ncbi:choice-of-anchor J domain-containing protein [Aeromicrobium duanguangcaii]|uniref:choice-of-anchor J domain-containing protein n=1 Tax=Aeromicrobium duanguangcaii TaxID=2968086 RepID=UPI002017167D|nr:immune inhibitor A [Aeromicrobium duanguangcaii]
MKISWKPLALSAVLAASALSGPALVGTTATAAPPSAQAVDPRPVDPQSDLKNLTVEGKKVQAPKEYRGNRTQSRRAAPGETPPVGTVREWLALDDVQGGSYYKEYTLRGDGDHIEVWVANDIAFPADDCRGAEATVVTDAQVAGLVREFDTNIYPKESEAFSVAPERDGSNALIDGDFTGDGEKIVTLVDNVRDDNFYDFPEAPTYIAGFFSSAYNEYMDRNVMTIDAYDWEHRTGAAPVDESTDDLCTSRPARPRLYEGTFAHEYQHLLQYYTDPNESTAVNEGLSDFAQTLVGYVDGNATVEDPGGDSHLYCFQGFGTVKTPYNTTPRDCGGPENSFNLWDEGNTSSGVLADYGHAYQLMLYLYDKYGQDFISALHRDGEDQGIAGIEKQLEAEGAEFRKVFHDFQSMTLLDRIIGDAKKSLVVGLSRSKVTTPSLRSTVNLANPAAYATPGAAPNGADYVPLTVKGKPVTGASLRSATFEGAKTLPELPLRWTSVTDDPDRPGDAVLFSGDANSLDVSAVKTVAVPATNATLTFDAKYGAEEGYDYGYVQVSTDGGATYTSIAGDKTVDGPQGPALNGATDGFEKHTFDLSAYAGQEILLAFRYISDGGVNEGGLKVDNVAVGGTTISDGSNLGEFRSPTQIRPTPVENWHVKLVGIRPGKVPYVAQVSSDGRSSIKLDHWSMLKLLPAKQIVAVVSYDESTELVQQYAPYTLTVNGQVQPGGR